jgi:anti-anti-sigma regulatory factor
MLSWKGVQLTPVGLHPTLLSEVPMLLPAHPDRLENESLPGATVVPLPGPALGETNCSALAEQLADLSERDLYLDCGEVQYVTTAGLDLLLRLQARLAAASRRLCLLRLAAAMYEVLSVSQLTVVLEVQPPPARRATHG